MRDWLKSKWWYETNTYDKRLIIARQGLQNIDHIILINEWMHEFKIIK